MSPADFLLQSWAAALIVVTGFRAIFRVITYLKGRWNASRTLRSQLG